MTVLSVTRVTYYEEICITAEVVRAIVILWLLSVSGVIIHIDTNMHTYINKYIQARIQEFTEGGG